MLAYFDDGADFASMYVSGDPQHASGLRRAGGLAGTPEFGVERRSAGYDASGSWIGIDEWMLRCVELQYVVEFHYEWIRLASHLHAVGTGLEKEDEEKAQRDQEAMRDDPLDWDEAGAAPTPLPSQQPQAAHHHGGTISASSSSAEWMNMANSMTLSEAESFPQVLGFSHITDFFTLRSAGLSPREAARPLLATLIEELAGSDSGLTPESATRVDLLASDGETDHFGHPALFARSGAVDLVFGLGAAAGDNAPPNAIPAAAAALAAFGQAIYEDDEDDDDDDDDDDEDHRGEADGGPREAREEEGRGRRGASSRATLDVADLFGHVSYDARTLYKNESTREGGPSNGDAHPRRKLREAAMAQAMAQKAVSPLRPSLPTLGSLLANMRSVLAMCPRIRLLGLNGFLERAVGGERETVGLSELWVVSHFLPLFALPC
ncbi:hypothetical protein FA10DRAFT_114944 [Acaromyces ingoldii]|uniref:Uncharacterized protein n=1 Tax=Acaromyces ingoldii TaxID=215250 RepID=A0A316YLT0_9BASI|nr:hypothetical protein FA10DRAFT_114944 [Acaromyces ingoldii]PWN90510.1 hypothetical protein FA10DRAFT_114944 [Acaromyces ingoldii]